MRFGYWLPVFGGWLRNVQDERMESSWSYARRLAQRSEQIGFDLTLVAELNLNHIKGMDAPSLDAWSTAAALAAVTERLGIMVAPSAPPSTCPASWPSRRRTSPGGPEPAGRRLNGAPAHRTPFQRHGTLPGSVPFRLQPAYQAPSP
jgi:hypothetical protein